MYVFLFHSFRSSIFPLWSDSKCQMIMECHFNLTLTVVVMTDLHPKCFLFLFFPLFSPFFFFFFLNKTSKTWLNINIECHSAEWGILLRLLYFALYKIMIHQWCIWQAFNWAGNVHFTGMDIVPSKAMQRYREREYLCFSSTPIFLEFKLHSLHKC